MDVKPRRVELNIDRLVVDGAERLDRAALGRAVERELGRLLAAPGAGAPEPRAAATTTLDSVSLTSPPGEGAVGRSLAHSLHRKLAR